MNIKDWIKFIEQRQEQRNYKDRIDQALDDIMRYGNNLYTSGYFERIAKIYNIREYDLKNAYDKRTTEPIYFTMDFGEIDGFNEVHKSGCFHDAINKDKEWFDDRIWQAHHEEIFCSNDIPSSRYSCYVGDNSKTQKRKQWDEIKAKQEEQKLTDRYKVLAIKMGQGLRKGKIFRKLVHIKKPTYSTEYVRIQREFERLNNIL